MGVKGIFQRMLGGPVGRPPVHVEVNSARRAAMPPPETPAPSLPEPAPEPTPEPSPAPAAPPEKWWELDGFPILFDPTHGLPDIRQRLPDYSKNVGRIAEAVARKYPPLSVIDIGANVGDTVAIIRAKVNCPVLCVEGCDTYLPYLERNIRQFPGVELEPSYVGYGEGGFVGGSVVELGTSRLVASGEKVISNVRPLEKILDDRPAFKSSKLVKIDTDGFDLKIISANLALWKARRPVIFFEYDPFYFEAGGDDGPAVIRQLRDCGYGRMLVWENTGDYLLRCPLSDEALFEDVHAWSWGRKSMRYVDIAVFAEEDGDLCDAVRRAELFNVRASRP